MSRISFSDDAIDSLVTVAQAIPAGYVIRLDGHGPLVPSHDVQLVEVTADGVAYRTWDDADDDAEAAATARPVQLRPWDSIAELHVY